MSLVILTAALLSAPETTMSAIDSERSERIQRIFHDVRAHNLHLLDELYTEDLVFQDPLERIEGLADFRIYMKAMYQYVEDIQWEFTEVVVQGDTHVLFWTMTLQTKGLNKGKPFSVDGMSHIRFDAESNKAVFHRDYFDMGEYIYERAPVVRALVRYVKRRLHKAVKKATAEVRAEEQVDG